MNISNISFGNNLKIPTVQKRNEKKETKTPRDLLDLPSNFTILPNLSKKDNEYNAKELFTIQFNSATKLSDGSRLIRPVCLSLGRVDIIPSKDDPKEYTITIKNPHTDSPIIKTVSENELLSNKTLCRGKIKPTDEKGKYLISFKDIDGLPQRFVANEKGCLKLLSENLLYM